MMHLEDFLAANKSELIARWTERVKASLDGAAGTFTLELVDHLPVFMDELISALRRERGIPESSPLPHASPAASEHGQNRLRLGFSVEEVVREYGILRGCILELIEKSGSTISLPEFRILSDCLDAGTREAISRYVRDRDEQFRRQASEHFAFLGHELRNKLSAARVALALLEPQLAAGGRAVEILQRNLTELGEMIDRTLHQIREQATLDLRLAEVNVGELLAKIADEMTPEAEELNIQLQTTSPILEIRADPVLLRSAVSNLVSNALKFSRPATTVTVRAVQRDGNIVIEVEDGCGGIPPDALSKLFNPFIQVGIDRSGFGLGLAIAKQAARAHGGKIEAQTLLGKGCIFRLEFPRDPESNRAMDSMSPATTCEV